MKGNLAKICVFVAAATVMFSVGSAEVLDLAGEWRLSGSNEVGMAISCPIAVPGDTHSALLAAKLIPNPYWGCNETNVQWVGRQDWTISRTFEVPRELLDRKEVILRLEDCDTFCTVRINGHIVGKTTDRFQRYDFDVKPFLCLGENRIEGLFESAERIGNERRRDYDCDYKMINVKWALNQSLVRKPACHGGWDWGPALMVSGFCGPVSVIATDGPRVDYVYTEQDFRPDFSHCTLTVFADLSDGHVVTNRIEIDNPPLWWPNGYGRQDFYTYSVKIGDEVVRRRIGLRKIEVLNEKTKSAKGEDELSLVFQVNGRRIFAKGANWIPCDAIDGWQSCSRYRDLLQSAVDANMNMLRLWGGGQYEKDCFYDMCDELGLLVWHDMMCSCAVYPGDVRFLSEIEGELNHQLRRLRDHASIAMWCGDNECLGALTWFKDGQLRRHYFEQWLKRSRLQGDCVKRYDPARVYWPSSPCCGPDDFGNGWKVDSKGDMHNWFVWHDNSPFEAYYASKPRFCSEFGYQSFPSIGVAKTFATEEEIVSRASGFEYHQKNPGGNHRIRETMLRYFEPPRDRVSELLLSQFQQGMAIKMAVDGWRAQRPRCMGTLYWQLNDNWPVASWSSIEYGGKWKPLHYLAKRFYAPISVVAHPEVVEGKANVKRGAIYAVNDTDKSLPGELCVEYWTYAGRIVKSERRSVLLPADSSTRIGAFKCPAISTVGACFLVMTLKTPAGDSQNDWHFGFYKDLPLPTAKIESTCERIGGGKWQLVLSSDKPAFFVWAESGGVPGEFSDNCFTLLPGRDRRLVFSAKFGEYPCPLFANPRVLSLKDLCADKKSQNAKGTK